MPLRQLVQKREESAMAAIHVRVEAAFLMQKKSFPIKKPNFIQELLKSVLELKDVSLAHLVFYTKGLWDTPY